MKTLRKSQRVGRKLKNKCRTVKRSYSNLEKNCKIYRISIKAWRKK